MAERARAPGSIQVGSVALSLPGRNAAFGRRVAERAMSLVAARLPPGGGADLAALKLRVRTRSGNEGEVSQAVADAVLRALSRSIR